MSNETSRRELLEGGSKSLIVVFLVWLLKLLGLGGLLETAACATQWEFVLSEDSDPCTVSQATRLQYGSDMVVGDSRWRSQHNSEMIIELNGYQGDWMFRVNGELRDGPRDSPESVMLRPGDHVEWVVVS